MYISFKTNKKNLLLWAFPRNNRYKYKLLVLVEFPRLLDFLWFLQLEKQIFRARRFRIVLLCLILGLLVLVHPVVMTALY